MTRLDGVYADKESFHEWIMACCDTLVRNEDKLYNMTRDMTRAIDVTFPIRVNQVATMVIEIEKIVQVCKTNNIEISGNVFKQPAEEIEKIVGEI